jgi:biofilm PGA synthesis N-glycosyltransferase PgaC
VTPVVDSLLEAPALTLFVAFLCAHPFGSGLFATISAFAYIRRQRSDPGPEELSFARSRYPTVSVVIPAHNEDEVIVSAVEQCLRLRWPQLDVIVVDDGSTDRTAEVVRPYVDSGAIRLLSKQRNEGKSMAINDALGVCLGDLVLVMDADGLPDEAALEWMVPHMNRSQSVAAVTGNPRVLNTRTTLARLQAIEFSATVGVHRRADAVWGRLTTFSGLCALIDRGVVLALGGFAPDMATEDIEMTWRLQLAGWEAEYEPAALFGMQVPEGLATLWRQRLRWVKGLAQVLRRHGPRAASPRNWRMWPVLIMSMLSIVWAHALALYVVTTLVLSFTATGRRQLLPLLVLFGAVTVLAGMAQALIGMRLDHRRDPSISRQWPWVPWYPLCYWVLNVLLVVRGTLPGLLRRPQLSVWNINREVAGSDR